MHLVLVHFRPEDLDLNGEWLVDDKVDASFEKLEKDNEGRDVFGKIGKVWNESVKRL